MRKVELHHAFVWDCDECGRENFCNGLDPELTAEEIEELKEIHGIEPSELGGKFLLAPATVICKYCKTEFETDNEYLNTDD